MFPCPCSCQCGALTTVAASKVTSAFAARLLRCPACTSAGHVRMPIRPEAVPGTVVASPPRQVPVFTRVGKTPEEVALDRQIAQDLAAERRAAAFERFENGLPEKFRKPLDERQVDAVEDRLRRLRLGRGGHQLSLLTYGAYGSGKTWVGYSYLRCAVREGLVHPSQIRYGTEAQIIGPLANASAWEISDRLNALLTPSLRMLLIDDVGNMDVTKDRDRRQATYAQVINWMWENNRALILTTNLRLGKGNALEGHVGVAAYERIRNMVGKDVVFRDRNRRAELTQQWESEYQQFLHDETAPDACA